jgi:hypothetical protein
MMERSLITRVEFLLVRIIELILLVWNLELNLVLFKKNKISEIRDLQEQFN